MADFHQNGFVTTLHSLKQGSIGGLETHLERLARIRPIGLVLPAHYSEFETPAMQRIVAELRAVRYLQRICVVLVHATREQCFRASTFFEGYHTPVTVIWIDSHRMNGLLNLLENHGLSAGGDSKGRSCWIAFGYLLAMGDCAMLALHDCDIVSHGRELLPRLCYPVADPHLGFEFCKSSNACVTDLVHGRLMRLFVGPLIRALEGMAPGTAFLKYLASFRYPLGGEFAMNINLARVNRIPCDWGFEVGVLAEVFHNCALSRTCQVELLDDYEHKHELLVNENPTAGLTRMAGDIAKSLFRTLAAEGLAFRTDEFPALGVRYVRLAQDAIARYYADAMLNGLRVDRHAEESTVAAFAKSLHRGAAEFLNDPLGLPPLPSWNCVLAAIPEFFDLMRDAVDNDSRELAGAVG